MGILLFLSFILSGILLCSLVSFVVYTLMNLADRSTEEQL